MQSLKYHQDGTSPALGQIFVFGSNLSGIHGAGAARAARLYYGAQLGVAEGMTGNSYAIPTVKHGIRGPLPLEEIERYVKRFIVRAGDMHHHEFFITRIGCGLAGYDDCQISRFFKNTPSNCSLPVNWQAYLET